MVRVRRCRQDISKVMDALVEMFKSRGAAVRGDCLHNGGGRAHITKGHGHGGPREAGVSSKPAREKPRHPHAVGVASKAKDESVAVHAGAS